MALYNVVPFRFAEGCTLRQLRILGWMLLFLDAIALFLASLPVVQQRNFPVLALLLFFEASVIVGFESPHISTAGMATVTLAAVGYGSLAIRYGDSWRDAVLWTFLCLFLGTRGALIARARWRYRQQLWADNSVSSPSVAAKTASAESVEACAHLEPNPLSNREREILIIAAQGCGNREIADRLFVTERTVGTHFERIARKLEARNRCHAVAIALAHHWIEAPPVASLDDSSVRP